MNHGIDFIDSNVVIIANTFNVNILNPVWMYKNKIFSEKRHDQMILDYISLLTGYNFQ